MFIFHCHRCKETFRVYLENLFDKESLCCPNCGLPFPADALKELNQLSKCYREAIDILKKTNDYQNGWSISIAEHGYPRPREVSKYDNSLFNWADLRQQSYWDTYDIESELSWLKLLGKK